MSAPRHAEMKSEDFCLARDITNVAVYGFCFKRTPCLWILLACMGIIGPKGNAGDIFKLIYLSGSSWVPRCWVE